MQGVGTALGNLMGGASLEVAQATGWGGLLWALMALVGLVCARSVATLDRSGLLAAPRPRPVPVAASTNLATTVSSDRQ